MPERNKTSVILLRSENYLLKRFAQFSEPLRSQQNYGFVSFWHERNARPAKAFDRQFFQRTPLLQNQRFAPYKHHTTFGTIRQPPVYPPRRGFLCFALIKLSAMA